MLFFVSGFALLSICAVAYAYTSTTTFILDNGNDLGAIIVKSTEYYEPTVPYTNASGVKQRMLDAYDYPGDFYTSRNFTKSIIDGSDPYIFVDFAKPKYMGDIDTVHNIF